jgi:glucosamine--fructose-6-phosphate aminotransferase (isomerizing)
MEEVKARKGNMIVITNEGNEELNRLSEIILRVPKCSEYIFPILAAVPLQLLSYYIAKYRDCSIDQPRNLAKAVTVE